MNRNTILIIDDEPDFVELTRMRLEANGFHVLSAANGREGLAVAKAEHPSLVLLDVMMPEMDGFETLQALRADPKTAHTRVVMLTARGESRSMLKAKELGATDYLIKPCEAEELLKWVKRYA